MPRSTKDEWVKRIARWRKSKLTAHAFADLEGVKPGTLSWWACRLGMTRGRGHGAVELVPLHIAAEPAVALVDEPPIEIVLAHQRVVRVRKGFDPHTLAAVVDALERGA